VVDTTTEYANTNEWRVPTPPLVSLWESFSYVAPVTTKKRTSPSAKKGKTQSYAQEAASFGAKVRKIRTEQKRILADLDHTSGVSQNQISKIERGKCDPGLTTMEALVGALGASLSALLNDLQNGNGRKDRGADLGEGGQEAAELFDNAPPAIQEMILRVVKSTAFAPPGSCDAYVLLVLHLEEMYVAVKTRREK
jgi:transcriptional regulator with XRE-family HTH domain